MSLALLPTRDRNPDLLHKNSVPQAERRVRTACGIFLLWAILLGCGAPGWQGGIRANLAWSSRGLRVLELPEGSPALAAGLQLNDNIIAIDGVPTPGIAFEECHQRLAGEVGSHVLLRVQRGEEEFELNVPRVPYGVHAK